jgi:N-acetylneuraminic acid mutarotase
MALTPPLLPSIRPIQAHSAAAQQILPARFPLNLFGWMMACMVGFTPGLTEAQSVAVSSLSLLDANTDLPIATLADGDTIDLALTGTDLAIEALCSPATVGSVVFALTGEQTRNQTESNAPYALFGDVAGDFTAWTPSLGDYSLTATAFSGSGGSGSPGPGLSLDFTVINSAMPGAWSFVPAGTSPTARHECSFVQAGDQFLLMGGRGIKPVDAYDLNTGTWSPLNLSPQEIHHFQATDFHGLVYIIGAFEGNFPFENGIPFIYIYDPLTDTWYNGPSIPSARIRGSAGLVLHNDIFYVVAGITNGHTDGWVPWLDAFDPQSNTWTQLSDAPRARDHFHAAVIDNKLYCAGGRRSGEGGSTFSAVVLPTDVYDFATGTWSTLPSPAGDIPTGRAGCMSGVLNGELIVFGGESGSQFVAHDEAEAFDPVTGTWRSLDNMARGRHGTQAIVNNGGIYTVAGSGNRGGTPELNTMEQFHFGTPTTPTGVMLTPGSLNAVPLSLTASVGDTLSASASVNHSSGSQAVLVREAYLEGDAAFQLPSAVSTPFAIAPGKDRSIDVEYRPTAAGTQTAELVLVYGAFADTLRIPLSGAASNCDASQAPDGLNTVLSPSQVSFSWNEVPGTVACELQGGVSGGSSAKLRFSVPPPSISVPANKFLPATTYDWRIRCACSTSPLVVTPFSPLASFTTPSAKEGGYNALAEGFGVAPTLHIQPSPATQRTRVHWAPVDARGQLRMRNALGQTIWQQALDGASGQYELLRGAWPSGIYWLELELQATEHQAPMEMRQAIVWE